ncbi:FAD-binding oxidoreductase [Streptomyces sp. R28]|uniref:FAD-binding oxidoreductase n=1 Tax=Streptomyces sp. R28 TaxID=3238628 RepID=A0AB39QD02_9ACTN
MTRSWWGWGNVEDAVGGAELDALLGRARAVLPGELTAHEPPGLASLGLAGPRVTPPASLAGLCSTDPADRAAHAHGKAFRDVVRNLHGDLRHVPDLVARPRDERDVTDLLESMRVVTPVGISESRRLPGSGAGPSPDRLFLGSEGTLGIITEAWMRLQERPRWRAGTSVRFSDYESAVAATRAVAQSGLNPANCRLLDATEALINAGVSVGGGVLVLAFESADHPVRAGLERAVELCRDHGGEPSADAAGRSDGDARGESGGNVRGESAAETWRSSFLRMPYQRDALARHSVISETFETACTWDRFGALHQAVTEAARRALAEVAGAGVIACRFTHVYPDGPAPYFSVYAPGRWGSIVSQWDDVKSAVSEAIAESGGTITHHHAVGRDHRPWYDRQRPGPFAAALTAAKSTLDPAGVLNPGVLLPAR